jgi:zinc transport system substrate-binding protein
MIGLWVGAFAYFSFFPEERIPDYSKDDGRISIVATMYPIAYFAMDLDPVADITTIIGPGVEPHDYEPTIRDVQTMQDAELFLVIREIDEWAVDAMTDRNGPTIDVMASLGLDPEGFDPHVWLNPFFAETIVRRIGQQLQYIDPTRAAVIAQNVEAKIAEIRKIDTAYRTELSNCEIPVIVTAHDAFQYLAEAYDFTAVGIAGINPDAEPSAAAVAEIVDRVRTYHAPTVFFETLTSDKLAKTIAEEAGATSEVLDPLESLTPGHDAATGYTDTMRKNLEKISAAMVCRP